MTQPQQPSVFKTTQPLEQVPLLDVGRENSQLEPEILAAITQVTRAGRFVLGPEVTLLERRVAAYCDVPHAIGCASGSDALLLALMAADIQPGDEVIVPSFTFFATASCVVRLGAIPVFVDILPDSFNIDPAAVRAAVTSKTKAIIPVHLFGKPAAMGELKQVASEHELVIVEDAAQSLGARYRDQPVGSIGDMGCFSFYPTKNLGGFGDGGMLTTTSDELADRLRLLRAHGMRPRYYHEVTGINSRLDTIQATVLNVKLPYLSQWTEARRRNASRYAELFAAVGLDAEFSLPEDAEDYHVWNQFTIRVRNGKRDELRAFLADQQVGTEIYYPVPLHQQACFSEFAAGVSLPETERAAEEVLSLPIFPTMVNAEQETVVMRIAQYVEAGGVKKAA